MWEFLKYFISESFEVEVFLYMVSIIILTHSRRGPRYLGQATTTVQDGARDNLCFVTS